jgi:cysteine dioxygenase
MKTIEQLAQSISDWIEINGEDNFHLLKLINFLKEYNGEDWTPCSKISNSKYCRHKQNIEVKHYGKIYDIFILTWKPGCGTPVHNHPNTGCIYKVLKGKLNEELYDSSKNKKEPFKISELNQGKTSYIDDTVGFHRIINPTNSTSISLHIYETGYKPKCFECFKIPSQP